MEKLDLKTELELELEQAWRGIKAIALLRQRKPKHSSYRRT